MIPPAKGMVAFSSIWSGCSKARSSTLIRVCDHVPTLRKVRFALIAALPPLALLIPSPSLV